MSKKISFGCLIMFFCMACQPERPKIQSFGYDIPIKHTVRNPEIMALIPEGFFRLDSLLVTFSPRLAVTGFGRIFSLNTFQEVGKFGSRGKGPLEVIWASAFPYTDGGKDTAFMAYDLATRSVITYTLLKQGDTLTMRAHDKRRVDQGDVPMQNNLKLCRIGKDHFMGACFHHRDSLFSLISPELKQIEFFGNSPIPENITNAANELQGKLTASYNIALYTPLDCPYIACYTMADNRPVKLWDDAFSDIFYNIEGRTLKWDLKRSRGETEDVKIGKRYIYILWYDDVLNNYFNRPPKTSLPGAHIILIYDHKGNRIAQLRTDIDLYNIELSDDERTLYALTAPDCSLVTFDLPEEYPPHD